MSCDCVKIWLVETIVNINADIPACSLVDYLDVILCCAFCYGGIFNKTKSVEPGWWLCEAVGTSCAFELNTNTNIPTMKMLTVMY